MIEGDKMAIIKEEDFETISEKSLGEYLKNWDVSCTCGTLQDIKDDVKEIELNGFSYSIMEYFKIKETNEYYIITEN